MSVVKCGFISCSVYDDVTNNSDNVGFACNLNFNEIIDDNNSCRTKRKGCIFQRDYKFSFQEKQKNVFWCVSHALFTLYCVK